MPGTEILRVRNCNHMTFILYFHLELVSITVSLKTLRIELVQLDCMII